MRGCGVMYFIFFYFKTCTGHITTGSLMGRGNQYIQLVKVLFEPQTCEVGGECVTTAPPWHGVM